MIHVTNDSHHREITRKAAVTNISKQLQQERLKSIFIKDSYQRVDVDSCSWGDGERAENLNDYFNGIIFYRRKSGPF